ncbi:MAG TPA: hypothetical protein VHS09_08035, partial [Polyangiaceae bacterium]|nr:hypothetical protein [Polyangiaceae bacterium]
MGGLSAAALVAACGSSNSGGGGGADAGHGDGTASGSGSGGGSGSGSGGGSGSGSGGGSGGGSGSGSGGGSGSGSGSSGGDSGIDGGQPTADPSVYQHHRNGTRDGLYVDKAFDQTTAKTTHVTTFMGTVSGDVYAQPLYVENGAGGAETFIVATQNNHLTAINATTGAVLWDTGPATIGQYATKNPPGGRVDSADIGITGTPYIDIGSRTIFFDAMTTPDSNASYHHKVHAVNLDTGALVPGWAVDVNTAAAGFDSGIQNQRGALQFLNGVLYVPYGGYNGDGGTYYGSVIGFPVATPQKPTWWHTKAAKGGIWGPGALPTDGTYLFPVTGNTSGANNVWGGGEAVIRLTAGPAFSGAAADYFAPTNWQDLDDSDTDLGGASEVIFDMPGAQYPHLVAAGGKDANLYILNRDNLGGIGGQLLMTGIGTNQVKGAPAVYTTAKGNTYVALHIEGGTGKDCPSGQGGNLVVVQITQSPLAAKTVWCSTQSGLASPMVTTTNGTDQPVVWAASNALYAWDGDLGTPIVDGTMTKMSSSVQGWNTPIDAKGRMVVGVTGQLYVF